MGIQLRVGATLLLTGCVGAAAQHEGLGDRAYAERQFGQALVEYRLSLVQRPNDPNLHAKAASAALHARDLFAAAEEYVLLATTGGEDRLGEAVDGLERVARAAADAGDRLALGAAVDGLREAAPDRALGPLAPELVRELGAGSPSDEVLSVLFGAAAVAPDARLQDSLLFSYAVVLRQLGRCEQAIPAYEGVMRRQVEPAVVDRARSQLGYCALRLGEVAHDRGLPLTAEQWFLLAVKRAGNTQYGRRAYLGLGDVLFARRDLIGAAVAYESAMLGGIPGDSIAQVAVARLRMVERAGTGVP